MLQNFNQALATGQLSLGGGIQVGALLPGARQQGVADGVEVAAVEAEPGRKDLDAVARVKASSELGGRWSVARAIDGLLAYGWMCKDGDAAPVLTIEFER